jgi:hypothetical protein
LKDASTGRRKILKCIINNKDEKRGLDLSHSGWAVLNMAMNPRGISNLRNLIIGLNSHKKHWVLEGRRKIATDIIMSLH